jgi:hypothetical protein
LGQRLRLLLLLLLLLLLRVDSFCVDSLKYHRSRGQTQGLAILGAQNLP